MASRDYQEWAIREIWRYFENNTGNPIIAMPTGSGKAHVVAGLLKSIMIAFPRTRAMVATHVKEIVAHNYAKFLDSWPNAPAGIFSAGLNKKEFHQPITFCGIASVARRAAQFGYIDILFIDECDLVGPDAKAMYNKLIAELKKTNPALKVIGLTATPWRQGMGLLTEGDLFTDIAVDMTGIEAFNWFIEEGYLVPLIPKRTTLVLNTEGVHIRGGEFVQGELQLAVDKRIITLKALSETLSLAYDRKKWLVFASGVEHAKHVADMLTNEFDVPCKAIYSGMSDAERDAVLEEHRSGKIRAIANNNILTTGYDDPGIDLILMLRPTESVRLWVQMLGRGTRPLYSPGYDLQTKEGRLSSIANSSKINCLVLDFAGNTKKHGAINNPRIPGRKGNRVGDAPVKVCEVCGIWNHISAKYCGGKPHPSSAGCGSEFFIQTKLKMEASTSELIIANFPITETFKVDHIAYSLHSRVGKPDSIKVSYYCGLHMFTEFVCPEHENYAGVKAKEWWRKRTKEKMPLDTDTCLELIPTLPAATHIRVWVNKPGKYDEITGTCFDGTAFGTISDASVVNEKPPTVNTEERIEKVKFNLTVPEFRKPDVDNVPDITQRHRFTEEIRGRKATAMFTDDWDDDIPF